MLSKTGVEVIIDLSATALAQTPQPCFSPGCSIGLFDLMVGGLLLVVVVTMRPPDY